MSNQIYLMKVAQHGKNFLSKEEFSFDYFVRLCKDLRILHNIRISEKPRLITYQQYKKLEIKDIVNRLVKVQNFYLAFEIYNYFGYNVKEIYEKWAISFIKVIFQCRILVLRHLMMKNYNTMSKFKEN